MNRPLRQTDEARGELLPIVATSPPVPRRDRPTQAVLMQTARVALFAGIVWLIHLQGQKRSAALVDLQPFAFDLQVVRQLFPGVAEWGPFDSSAETRSVVDSDGKTLGIVAQTSPLGDDIIGFSGPTNVLIAFDADRRIVGTNILWSRDTKEHVRVIEEDAEFLSAFDGMVWGDAEGFPGVDAVSGATLTSLAIAEAVIRRLGGDAPSLKFPGDLTPADVQPLFADVKTVTAVSDRIGLWSVRDAGGAELGSVLRTSPSADNIVGYQGPTDTLIARDPAGKVTRIWVRESYDNDPYVGYLNDDYAFPDLFDGMTLDEVAAFDLEAHYVEGVSGATMTSMAVANGVIRSAAEFQRPQAPAENAALPKTGLRLSLRDAGTLGVIGLGVVIAFTRLRGIKWFRVVYQLVLIGFIGFANGEMLSQAMLSGWSLNGIPWRSAFRLVVITGVALTFPVLTKRNLYCAHLCPHGALQQLLPRRWWLRGRISPRFLRCVSLIPALLLGWVIVVSLTGWPFGLVDIEPFDAYLFRIAGPATLVIAIVGLWVSLFVPLAYCRYGCPTGALLEYLRRHRRSEQFSIRDVIAIGLFGLAWMIYLVT